MWRDQDLKQTHTQKCTHNFFFISYLAVGNDQEGPTALRLQHDSKELRVHRAHVAFPWALGDAYVVVASFFLVRRSKDVAKLGDTHELPCHFEPVYAPLVCQMNLLSG